MDSRDAALLAELQRDGHATAQELSEKLGLSPSQIGRRRQRLETEGIIEGYAARLDPKKLGLSVQAFVQVHLSIHGPDEAASFARLCRIQPEINAAWTLTGDADYLLRVFVVDLSRLNALIHEVLLPHPAVSRVQSQIVMDALKRDAPLPT